MGSSEGSFEGQNGGVEYKGGNEQLETIRTVSRVPGNPNYYEKEGVRTYGDGMDHEHEPKVSERYTIHDMETLTVRL